MTLRRDTIVTVLALLVIAIALPFAIMDTLETGRVYIFSRQFLEELPRRFTGRGRLRFILQPVTAILLGLHGGLPDAKAGHPPYLFGLLFGAKHRRELLRSGVAAIRNLLAFGINHGHRVSSGPLSLGASWRSLAGWADSYLLPLRSLQSTNHRPGAEVCGEIPTREQHHEVLMLKKMVNSCVVGKPESRA